jgi:uncharacterized DUF497 family protein
MKIFEIIWLSQFVEKIERKHGVSVDETEQIFANHPRVHRIEKGDVEGNDLYRFLGQTDAGRYLAVFFIYKSGGKALIISARDMSDRERKSYVVSQK